jgi:citrate synthase
MKIMLSKSSSESIQALDNNRNIIRSSTGGWRVGKGVYSHGYSMLDELVGEKSYFQIMILNATGKLVERRLADWVEATFGCLSYPDPRIWCNQIGALAGEAKTSVVVGTTAGIMAADSKMYGMYTILDGVEFIQSALIKFNNNQTPADIIDDNIKKNRGKLNITGYLRPIAKGDERIEAMQRVSKQLEFKDGPHLLLAYQIEDEIKNRFDEGMNINAYMSAFLSDQGFTANEVYQMSSNSVMSGVTACYLDTAQKPNDSFLPLRCDDIEYLGQEKRNI